MSQGDLRAYLSRPASCRERVARRWLGLLLRGLLVIGALSGCAGTRERTPAPRWPPRVTPPPVVVTLAPTRVPIPTVSPLGTGTREPWALLTRSLAAPEAPVLSSAESYVTNERCFGDCVTAGNTSLLMTDFVPYWTHPDPVGVDHYEVWRATNAAYWDVASCATCSLVATSTGMTTTVTGSPPPFNPVGGTTDAAVVTEIDFYAVRAVNAGGDSAQSNMIGVVSYSLMQSGPPGSLDWPAPTPTYQP